MHASTMSTEELEKLETDVFDFFDRFKSVRVTKVAAESHFKKLGYTLTRPIFDTLQVYGVVERCDDEDSRRRYPFPSKNGSWSISEDGSTLIPSA